jgi:hypothetical protein
MMECRIPNGFVSLEVPNDWWVAAGMDSFVPSSDHYPATKSPGSDIVGIEEVEPPSRANGELWFRNRESVVEVLARIRAGEKQEPIAVWSREKTGTKKYIVRDGFHRFYLSIAVGYCKVPIKVDDFDLNEFLEKERNADI